MRSCILASVLVAAVCACSGCSYAYWNTPVQPPGGLIYTNVRAPLTADVTDVTVATSYGEATVSNFQDILITHGGFSWDDAAIQAAAQRGGLRKVHYADYEATSILGVFNTLKVIAYGE